MKHVINFKSDFMNTRESSELFINNFSSPLKKSVYTQWEHLEFLSDVWLTVHRNSVWIRKTN